MKHTAVQSFWDKIALKLSFEQLNDFISEFKKAKEMEKEQIKEAHLNGQSEWDIKALEDINKKLAQQYYKETYEQ